MNARSLLTVAALAALVAPTHASAQPLDTWPITHGIDCVGDPYNPTRPDGTKDPAGEPQPGSDAWTARDADSVECNKQRDHDKRYQPADRVGTARYGEDFYRQPVRFDGRRFRYAYMVDDAASPAGAGIPGVAAAEIYRPCSTTTCPALPAELERFEPPYPVVAIWHGAIAQGSHHRYAAQALAEAGYMAVLLNGTAATGVPNFPDGSMGPALLDWLASPASGVFGQEADLTRVGFVGHSAGAAAALQSQGDPRVDAFIAWDSSSAGVGIDERNCTVDPETSQRSACAPVMYLRADGGFASGLTTARAEYPADRERAVEPYDIHVARGMDVFHATLRSSSHTDYNGYGVGLAGNRYAEVVINYYTLAWLDRHVMGELVLEGGDVVAFDGRSGSEERAYRQAIATDAFERLTALRFDDSADIHNVSMGFFDPVQLIESGNPIWGGNVPYTIEGMSVVDRWSPYFRNVCSVSVPDYVGGSDGEPGSAVAARADTAADGDLRFTGCPIA